MMWQVEYKYNGNIHKVDFLSVTDANTYDRTLKDLAFGDQHTDIIVRELDNEGISNRIIELTDDAQKQIDSISNHDGYSEDEKSNQIKAMQEATANTVALYKSHLVSG